MTLPRFDYVGSLTLASALAKAEGWIGDAAARRATSRDDAHLEAAFAGPYANAARTRAAAEDDLLVNLDDFATTAAAWATAWAAAVDKRNQHYYDLAVQQVREQNEARLEQFHHMRRWFPDSWIPYPQMGRALAPRAADPPSGQSFAPTSSFVTYRQSGVNMVPDYSTSD